MSKARSDAKWSELKPKQREQLESWLFEEHVSYKDALERAKTEFEFKGGLTSLKRFYQRRSQERMMADILDLGMATQELEGTSVSTGRLRGSAGKVMAAILLKRAMEAPDKVKEWGPVAKLVLQNEDNELRQKSNEIRQETLKFAQQRWDYEIKTKAEAVQAANKPPKPFDRWAHAKKMNDIRRQLWGADNCPNPLPESPAEAAKLEQEKRKQAEAHAQRQEQERLAEVDREKRRAALEAEREAEKKKPTQEEQYPLGQ